MSAANSDNGETPLMRIARDTPVLLGSASPRRREILGALGLPFVVRPADVDESQRVGDTPDTFLERVVWDKLRAAEGKRGVDAFSCVLVADTIVVLGDRILGKPTDEEDAVRLVEALVGTTHTVFTRFGLSWQTTATSGGLARRCSTVASKVTMRAATQPKCAPTPQLVKAPTRRVPTPCKGSAHFWLVISRVRFLVSSVCRRANLLKRLPKWAYFVTFRGSFDLSANSRNTAFP